MTQGIAFTIPLTPPSVNHYLKPKRGGGRYVSAEAVRFKEAVHIFGRGRSIRADEYKVSVTIYLGKNERLDADNGMKCLLDAMVDAEIIHSDAAIADLFIRRRCDPDQPRTEVSVEPF